MLSANPLPSKLPLIAATIAMLAAFGKPMRGQEAPSISVNYVRFTGVPDDWSHHRLVFSNPGTEEDAIGKGRHAQWLGTVNNPRYVIQQLKRGGTVRGPAADDVAYWRALGAEDAADRVAHGEGQSQRDKHGKPGTAGNQIKGDWGMDMGTNAKVGAGQFPAKFSFLTTSAFCASDPTPDFVVYNTGLAGSGGATGSAGASGQATIIAFDNLYSGCATGSNPSIYWSYNTHTAGTVLTSVVISSDGTQVAFVQSAGGAASLVVLKWAAGEGTGSVALNAASMPSIPATQTTTGSVYAACRSAAGSCQVTLAFNGTHNDTRSSPFYDYVNDALYVGDNSGILHKFTGVFSGTPAEVTTGGWPITINAGRMLTSPVLDSGTNSVFVGSAGGILSRVPASGGTVITSGILSNGTGVVDAPIVDSSAGQVYVFVAQDTSSACNNAPHACTAGVYQLATNFIAGATGTEKTVGGANHTTTGPTMYGGTFDNIYFTSADSSNPSGNLYVCGFTGSAATPALWQIPITNNSLGTPTAGPTLSTSNSICSPVTEFLNSSTDYIFLSVTAGNETGGSITCPSGNGCLMSFDVTTAAGFGPGTATNATALEAGGTSGVIIDNSVSSPAGTSQVYFTPLSNQTCSGNGTTGAGTGGCATQASQTGLN